MSEMPLVGLAATIAFTEVVISIGRERIQLPEARPAPQGKHLSLLM
jgi:hypothetical protein